MDDTHTTTNIWKIGIKMVRGWHFLVLLFLSCLTPLIFMRLGVHDILFLIYSGTVVVIILFILWLYILHFRAYKEKRRRILECGIDYQNLRGIKYDSILLKDESISSIDGKLQELLLALEQHEFIQNSPILVQKDVLQYARKKEQFFKTKDCFLRLVAGDIQTQGTSFDEIHEITETILAFRKGLEELAELLLGLTPTQAVHLYVYPEPDIHREMLYEENSWIEGEAHSMLAILGTWMEVHREEVQGEKEKLLELLKQEDSSIQNILRVTDTIRQNTLEPFQVQV